MNLTENPEAVTWPETHYVFIEKVGPIDKTAPACWKELHSLVPAISEHNSITGYLSLYKIQPVMIYRAGVSLAAKPSILPPGVFYEKYKGGKFMRFVMTGPYSDLPAACGRVVEIAKEQKISTPEGFRIEHYVTDPRTTPEDQLVTHILIPAL